MHPVRLVDICRFLQGDESWMFENWSQSQTVFCARQVRGTQIVQTFSKRVKPQTDKFLVLNGHWHIEYMHYLKKLYIFPLR